MLAYLIRCRDLIFKLSSLASFSALYQLLLVLLKYVRLPKKYRDLKQISQNQNLLISSRLRYTLTVTLISNFNISQDKILQIDSLQFYSLTMPPRGSAIKLSTLRLPTYAPPQRPPGFAAWVKEVAHLNRTSSIALTKDNLKTAWAQTLNISGMLNRVEEANTIEGRAALDDSSTERRGLNRYIALPMQAIVRTVYK